MNNENKESLNQQPMNTNPMNEVPVQPMNTNPMNEVPVQPMNTNPMNEVPVQPMNTNPMNTNPMNTNPMNTNPMNEVPVQPTNMNPMNEVPVQPMNTNPMNTNKKSKNNKTIYIIIGVVAAFVVVLLAVICFKIFGTKTLTCTNTESSMGMKMEAKLTAKFSNDKVKSANAVMTIDLGSFSSYKDQMINQIKKQYNSSDYKNVKTSIKSEGDKIIVNIGANRSTFKTISSSDSETYKSVKKDLEKSGWSCK